MTSSMTTPSSDSILIIDDVPENLRLLSRMLECHGYRVRRSISGKLALHAAQLEPPSLVLLDINMPEMDGYEVCRQLKNDDRTSDVPIIFISALDQVRNKLRAFEMGAVDYITKPFQEPEVLARVQTQLTIQQQQRLLIQHNQTLERSQQEIELLLATVQAASRADTIDTALRAILQQVSTAIQWDYAEAWMQSDTDATLELRQTYCRTKAWSNFCRLNHGSINDADLFSSVFIGRVWATLQAEWQVIQHSNLDPIRKEIATKASLRTVFAVPVVQDGQAIAVLSFYSQANQAPDHRLMDLVEAVALQLGTFIQRYLAEAALRRVNMELKRLVSLDGLTQLANRRRFDEYLAQEWRRLRREQHSLSLLLCDVDHFKAYNDRYGHQAGDDCLKQIAQAIDQSIRRPADLAARYGGEEFAVILPNSDQEGAIHIAQTIQQAIAVLAIEHDASNVDSIVTISLGAASVIPSDRSSVTRLIAAADRALYASKDSGRNTFQVATVTEAPLPKAEAS
jgi:two-component system, cell cycle response regulator